MAIDKSIIERQHPAYQMWEADEAKQRASYYATLRLLSKYLVPHRFEGDEGNPEDLPRSALGYGLGLNKTYLQELMGHVRSAARFYTWGLLEPGEDPDSPEPVEGLARLMWDDITRDNRTWTNFFHRDTLESMLTTPGCLVVVDISPVPVVSEADALAVDKRPFCKLVRMSQVEDISWGTNGIKWVKLIEQVDTREPLADEGDFEEYRVFYWLNDKGETMVARYDLEGEPMLVETSDGEQAEVNMGVLYDLQGQPTLPIVPAFFGEHPEIPWLGSGLLMGMDDISIDLYNTISEMREGYRDSAFSLWVYRGANYEQVEEQFSDGSRLVHVGDVESDDLNREAGDGSEVDSGMRLIEMGVRAWALSAKRRADEATDRATARSGIALQAEFQLDARPLLVEITNALDEVEGRVMRIAAQLSTDSPNMVEVAEIGVYRDTEFQLEDEAARISRIVSEFQTGVTDLPSEAIVPIAMEWLRQADILDLDEEQPDELTGEATTLGSQILNGLERQAVAEDRERTQRSTFPSTF